MLSPPVGGAVQGSEKRRLQVDWTFRVHTTSSEAWCEAHGVSVHILEINSVVNRAVNVRVSRT
jgi:hypothetical protein